MISIKKSIYLAGGLGFSELGRYSFEMLKKRIDSTFILIDPFEKNNILGEKIFEIEINEKLTVEEAKNRLIPLNLEIGKNNEILIGKSDIIVANLDGTDVDSGTAAEIGYAYALGKQIFGYRGDFRHSGDNLGNLVNLQVEYFIIKSKGKIFQTIEELFAFLDTIK
ncbi:MAG: 2-deoxyribonucleoside glycosidase [archaeon]|nr:2-deoxyribonucleoside glycosidase [archaeon]